MVVTGYSIAYTGRNKKLTFDNDLIEDCLNCEGAYYGYWLATRSWDSYNGIRFGLSNVGTVLINQGICMVENNGNGTGDHYYFRPMVELPLSNTSLGSAGNGSLAYPWEF